MTAVTGRELVALAGRVRGYLQDPARVWAARSDPAERRRQILQAVRVRFGGAVDQFGEAAVLACATLDPAVTAGLAPDGTPCRWCHAIARSPQVGRLPPVTEATLALLGDPCDRCVPLVARVALAGLDEVLGLDDLTDPAPRPTPAPASVVAAGKPPPPSYYRPRGRPWPADGRRPA